MRLHARGAVRALAAGLVVAAAAAAATLGGSAAWAAAKAPTTGCHLGNGIEHVIEITFDNVHYNRDNPNVLSDLEQMPALSNFITSQGTMLSNNHTPLIAHTADDTITNYSGLYGDRHGQPIGNTYETYGSGGTVTPKSSFAYWTGTYGLDAFPNQPWSANVPAAGAPPATPPAPWVPFTRAGCDVGDVSTANMELENVDPDLQNVFGANSPEVAQDNADSDRYKDQEVADYEGLGVHCAAADAFCASATGVRYGQARASNTAVADVLPDEPGGYAGFQAVSGHKYLQPQLAQAATSGGNRVVNGHTYPVTDNAGNLVDLDGNEIDGQYLDHKAGFPGFGPINAAQSLAYVADMQESGVPVTYAYISDVHERKSGQQGCSNSGTAQGPGDTCYQQNLASYNQAFQKFFQRLADDGIDASNTLFAFAADEGDHFAGANVGRTLQPACTGAPATPGYTCAYPAGTIGEQQVSIHGLLQNEFGDTTPFYNEPQGNSVYITGQPGATDNATRQLERDFANATANDAYDGNVAEKLAQYEADPTVEQLLHFVNADPNRTPSFTVFPKPDFYLSAGTSDSCATGTTAATAASGCSSITNGYAWNHGYYAPEINTTWLGLVGPGVAKKGVDGLDAAAGPNSSDGANQSPKLDTRTGNAGTWVDQTDIRPTVLSLTGLKDDYVDDGRVLTEDLTVGLGKRDPHFQTLAETYKQLNASVGKFGTDILVADTAAIKSGSSGNDVQYVATLEAIKHLGQLRDALATEIKQTLYDAEFDGRPTPRATVEIAQATALLESADALAAAATQ